jgi:hypothetical protein
MPPGTLAGGWTTLARRPHAHRDNNSNKRLHSVIKEVRAGGVSNQD